ncbi:hypothetical protein N7520_011802 [Penicillium odoratum]|uniref:uncharacterized protein n=1 Tax=Penicillium odoratum TaxID=1167516 RepID=UPI0025477E54|nr:uncharacterized protein N7520_011802 [Penicillium odoratum]KAJ5746620.1 hypothetical protein N7520_011802 [Penicillium odoratum]
MLSKKNPPQTPSGAFTRYRAAKASMSRPKRNVRDSSSSGSSRRIEIEPRRRPACPPDVSSPKPSTSPVVLIHVGKENRLFAAHENILSASPFFAQHCQSQTPSPPSRAHPHIQSPGKRINLPNEQPEVLSCVLEYLYKGDYYPRLRHNARRKAWELEDDKDDDGTSAGATLFHTEVGEVILRDTAIYCAAEKFNLPALQRLALRKQGLHTGITVNTILASARYAYAHTPDTESKLRAHYLALIIRCRGTFKRSGTMQMEMERGGKLFFDLFVAMCNHMVSFFLASVDYL